MTIVVTATLTCDGCQCLFESEVKHGASARINGWFMEHKAEVAGWTVIRRGGIGNSKTHWCKACSGKATKPVPRPKKKPEAHQGPQRQNHSDSVNPLRHKFICRDKKRLWLSLRQKNH